MESEPVRTTTKNPPAIAGWSCFYMRSGLILAVSLLAILCRGAYADDASNGNKLDVTHIPRVISQWDDAKSPPWPEIEKIAAAMDNNEPRLGPMHVRASVALILIREYPEELKRFRSDPINLAMKPENGPELMAAYLGYVKRCLISDKRPVFLKPVHWEQIQSMWKDGKRNDALALSYHPELGQEQIQGVHRYMDQIKETNPALQLVPADAKQVDRLTQVIATAPTADVYAERGQLYEKSEMHLEAVNDFTEAIKLAPDEPQWLWRKAMALDELEKYNEALADCAKALKLADKGDFNYMQALRIRIHTFEALHREQDMLADLKELSELGDDTAAAAVQRWENDHKTRK